MRRAPEQAIYMGQRARGVRDPVQMRKALEEACKEVGIDPPRQVSRGGGGDFAARLARLSGEARSRANWEHYQREFRAELADPAKWDLLPEPCQHSIAQAKRAVMGEAALNAHERRALTYREPVRRRAFAAQFSVGA